jgi:hypothetical protein
MTQITPAMFEAAIEAWFRVVKGAESNFLNGTPNPPVPPENLHDAMRAAITAAIDASGLVEANYKAFTDGMEAAAQICGSLAEVEYDDADGFEAATGCEAAIMRVVKEQRTEQALNKDTTNDQ